MFCLIASFKKTKISVTHIKTDKGVIFALLGISIEMTRWVRDARGSCRARRGTGMCQPGCATNYREKINKTNKQTNKNPLFVKPVGIMYEGNTPTLI